MADANLDKRRVNDANPTENLMKNAVFLGLGVDLEAVGRQCARITVLWSLKQCEIRRVRQDIALLHSQLRQPPRTDEPTQHIFESLADFFQHYARSSVLGFPPGEHEAKICGPGLALDLEPDLGKRGRYSAMRITVLQVIFQRQKPNVAPRRYILEHLPLRAFAVHLDKIG